MLSNEQLAALATAIVMAIGAVTRVAWTQGRKEAKDPPPSQCHCPPDLTSKLDRIGWCVDELRRDLETVNRRLK